MDARIDNPAITFPRTVKGLAMLRATADETGVPATTALLVETRASQLNGCAVCLDMHTRELRQLGETDERLFTLAAWREAPYFTDAERAALELTEAVTRLADRPDSVPDAVWDEAARHYDERQLGALVVVIAGINAYNRINAAIRQPSGDWVAQMIPAAA